MFKLAYPVVVAMFGLSAGTALAQEGNGNPFPLTAPNEVVGNPLSNDTGSQSYPNFPANPPVPVIEGQVLPTNGSEGPVETANSLPRGFENGTAAYNEAQRVSRYFADQAAAWRSRLASGRR